MGEESDRKALGKEAMKRLRESRKQTIESATARMKEQKKEIDSIKVELRKGDRTVPELSQATGIPSEKVMWYMAALKKYGQILEGEADGSYYRYQLATTVQAKGPEAREDAPD